MILGHSLGRIYITTEGEKMAESSKVVVFNRGQRKYQISGKRVLEPGKSIEVKGKEARLLLGQRDIVDADKVVPVGPGKKALKEENDKLKKENEQLKAKQEKDAEPKLAEGDEVELKDGSRALVEKIHKNGNVAVKGEKGKRIVPLKDLKKVA